PMIRFPCPSCGATISAADEYAGRKGKCPRCGGISSIPSVSLKASPPARKPRPADDEPDVAEPEEAVAAEEDLPPRRRRADEDGDDDRPRRRRDDDEDDEDRPRRRRRRDDDEDDEDRPRRRRRRRGPYADCPKCGARGDASKVSFTWWGGLVGPAIISCVRCNR